jgi:hypothetical protein
VGSGWRGGIEASRESDLKERAENLITHYWFPSAMDFLKNHTKNVLWNSLNKAKPSTHRN